MDIRSIIQQLQDVKNSERDKGTRFEEIVRVYLLNEPEYKTQYKDVVLWSKWEQRNSGDIGIDLVAEMRDGSGFVAIQCKCYGDDNKIQKPDIDSFLAASSKKEFVRRIIVATSELGKNAQEVILNQHPPVHVIGLSDLENSLIDWSQFNPQKPEQLKLKEKKKLRDHQIEAVNDVCNAFATEDRGKLIMACGTGKTFTSLKIAERIAGKGGLVLFLVPSLSLMSQTLREWIIESEIPLRCYAVCSDEKVGKHEDSDPTSPDDLAIPATTNGKTLAADWNKNKSNDNLTVIFSTYQSIDAISVAQNNGLPEFDLVVCDEAHRTTGAQLEGQDESQFVRVHNQEFIKTKKRLYMTATPRLYSTDTKQKAKEHDVPLWSMDDETQYGKTLHQLGFSKAVDQQLLSDYRVIVLGVSEDVINSSLQKSMQDTGKRELKMVDPAKIIGCWNGLAGRFDEKRAGKFAIKMKRAVAFTTSIKQSQQFKDEFQDIVQKYKQENPEDKNALVCQVRHVDGTQNALKRNEALSWLKGEPEKNECRILSNARCLSEGVDVPALDAVLFLTPRKSKVDVVQSVGRVMRKVAGKDYGYVILPIVIPAGMKPEDTLDNSETYQVVWDVLQALRAHDDRFNGEINTIELDNKEPERIIIDFIGSVDNSSGKKEVADSAADIQRQFNLTYEDIKNWKIAVLAQLVKRCGDKEYWEDWAKDVAVIAAKQIERIENLLAHEDHKITFDLFRANLQNELNPELTEREVVEMLSQHSITKPVFDALFGNSQFTDKNPVSLAMQSMADLLEDAAIKKDLQSLDRFYKSVKRRAANVKTAHGRQKIIIELYDKFFKTAFPKMSEKLGIVYTPVEVVDFIVRSVDAVLQEQFGKGIGAKDVHVLDPFTGTGTFIVRLLQSGLIEPKDLLRKYQHELHANEIVLLAYYIAAINIEETFHEVLRTTTNNSSDYFPFNGIVLTDTFQQKTDQPNQQKESEYTMYENSKRAKLQQKTPIAVIIANPPYSAGQRVVNDANKNQNYPQLDERIQNTYTEASTAVSKKNLYDSYIRAIRWATDRIVNQGVIGFVSNGSYIDGNSMDGMRQCFAEEFTEVYVFNCRGNQRTSGELSRQEGGKIFGSGSRAPIAITIFVNDPARKSKGCVIHYHDIGDCLSREEKLEILNDFGNIRNVDWQIITPNEKHDWIKQRNNEFDSFFAMGDKKDKNETTIFDVFSLGVATHRDAWCYNFSEKKLTENMKRMIDFYNEQRETLQEKCKYFPDTKVEDIIDNDKTKISWDHNLKGDLAKGIPYQFQKSSVFQSVYRPFCKQYIYYNRRFNERVYQMPRIFPEPDTENMAISVCGMGGGKVFSPLIHNTLVDLNLQDAGAQCFPYYVYEPIESKKATTFFSDEEPSEQLSGKSERIGNYIRRENITDEALQKFRKHYRDEKLSKKDIFYYIYGVLNSREYQQRFSAELKKQLPRIPFAVDFWGFSKAGRELAKLHLNYETLEKFLLKEKITGTVNYHVTEMRYPSKTDKTKIIYNSTLTLEGIPPETFEYIVNGKSALDWIIDRYKITTHKDSKITNDPNDWCNEQNNPQYIVNLIKRIAYLSVESVKIIDTLPPIDISYRLKQLEDLHDGWLYGEEGKTLSKTGIQWFKNQFNQFFN
ncbi:MAG: DEAD/DEAH box helicase family protein, partial [Planctomycetaceae bacterium]|nr:DEAD/DEAH box helicase family protein [Planctomycetaceae bacterium]